MQELKDFLEKNNMFLDGEKVQKLFWFYQFVLSENQKYNLTTIVEKQDFFVKHILDSLVAKDFFCDAKNVVDLGSGCGFPAMVLKICNPDINMTMIDSVGKKVNFLNLACKSIGLENACAEHVRIEDFAIKNREKFDICTARAVAGLNTLLEYALPLLKVGGKCIFYKSQKVEEEIAQSQNALSVLGGKIQDVLEFDLCGNKRYIVVVQKILSTPTKYPRGQNKPRLMPL